MMKLYQAEWCPHSHWVRAKLTELGIDYQAVNVSASGGKREELKELTGGSAIPVGARVAQAHSPGCCEQCGSSPGSIRRLAAIQS